MDGTEFLERFYDDEQSGGARAALRFSAEHSTGKAETEFNVWNVYLDADHDTLRFEHDFDDHEGTMALSDFTAGLRARLAAAGLPEVLPS